MTPPADGAPVDVAPSTRDAAGDAGALPATVYRTLRAIAQKHMAGERAGHTLTATALVHEAYLRMEPLVGGSADRFYHAAAAAMRRILIDHSRRRGAQKRGGGAVRLALEGVAALDAGDGPDDIVALDRAVSRLEEEDARCAAVVRLRFFAGLTGDQVAQVLGISPRQVDREWVYARAFLLRELRDAGADARD